MSIGADLKDVAIMKTKKAEEYLMSIGGRLDRDADGMTVGYMIEHGILDLDGAKAIGDLPHLWGIWLSGCRISNAFLDEISANDRLTHVEMNKCGLNDSSLKRFSRSSSVTGLRVMENNAITDAGVALVSQMEKLVSVDFSRCRRVTDACFAPLSQLTLLSTLGLDACPLVNGSGLTALTSLKHLKSLSFVASGLTNENASLLARFPNLTDLSIHQTEIGDSGASDVINGCLRLTSAGLQRTKVTDKCFDGLNGESQIDAVDVMYTDVTCAGLAKLHTLENLNMIYYSGQVNSAAEAESLRVLQKLRYFNLGDEVSDESRSYLKKSLPNVDVYP